MKFKIDHAAKKPAPVQYKTGDLVVYIPTGTLYLLGKKSPGEHFEYWRWFDGKATLITCPGNFDSESFSLFQGSITLSN